MMKIVTINIPDQYLDCLETMVNMGYFPSRSEAVRQSLKQFLTNEHELNQDLNPERFEAFKTQQMEALMYYK
ncbi:ribbon-helix-helix domain-containing protein [Candidatus Lokiarchaeum ossiferum]|uniref:ribbon-helix-helix domain-containing protein n=1 Tax=Candidatus Lokiarchaeum ossiferum TaxID=2951803 RepID=UPI00352E4051